MHCQIIDRYFNLFFVEIQLAKQNLKSDTWGQEFGCPNRYTGLPNGIRPCMYNKSFDYCRTNKLFSLFICEFKFTSLLLIVSCYQKNLQAINELNSKKPWCTFLKLVSAIFYQFFIFSPNDSTSKTMKNVFYFI